MARETSIEMWRDSPLSVASNPHDTVTQLSKGHHLLRHVSASSSTRVSHQANSIFTVFGTQNSVLGDQPDSADHCANYSLPTQEAVLKMKASSFNSYDLSLETEAQAEPEPYFIPSSPARMHTNSILSLSRNRDRILAMLDDVKRKRRLGSRRKSDITRYLDDLSPQKELLSTPDGSSHGSSHPYRVQHRVYQFLNHPSSSSPLEIIYHGTVFVIVLCCLILTVFATVKNSEWQAWTIKAVYFLEKIVITWFSIEFLLKLWSCSCQKGYRGLRGKLVYILAPSKLIDLLVLLLTTVVLLVNPSNTGHEAFVVSAFRGFHRFFQVAQVLTLKRSLKPWKILASVIYDQREQLFIILYTEFIVLCTLAYLAFLVERDNNQNFDSIADSMWWAIVTLSTVGYGDRVPQTWLGKLITTMFTILGVAIFALPAGIIGTGLALKIEEEERNQIRNMKKISAAVLIQRTWRAYKASLNHQLVSNFLRQNPMPVFKQHDLKNIAFKFITLAQFAIAKNRFRELMRPLDLKTVVQSYRDGQTEVLLRSKLLQQCVEELGRRIEVNENRMANMSMRLEMKHNVADQRLDMIAELLESVNRKVLANNVLVQLGHATNKSPGNKAHNNNKARNNNNNHNNHNNHNNNHIRAKQREAGEKKVEHARLRGKKSVPLLVLLREHKTSYALDKVVAISRQRRVSL